MDEALAWAHKSQWADGRGVYCLVDCLASDLEDGQRNGAPTDAVARGFMSAIMSTDEYKKSMAETKAAWAKDDAEKNRVEAQRVYDLRSKWGTSVAAEAIAAWPLNPEKSGKWSAYFVGEHLVAQFFSAHNDMWKFEKNNPGSEWTCIEEPGIDPTDQISGWSNAYGE